MTDIVQEIKSLQENVSKELAGALQKYDAEIKEFKAARDETKNQIAELTTKNAELTERLVAAEQKAAQPPKDEGEAMTLGQSFIKSQAFENLKKHNFAGPASFGVEIKSVTSAPDSAGAGAYSLRLSDPVMTPMRPLTIRDLLGSANTISNSIEFIREDVFTNNAAPQVEGELKAESNITFAEEQVGVKTIAHWLPATRQIISDFPMLQGIIDGRLRMGKDIKVEDQIIGGDGTGQNLKGLIPSATPFDTALTVSGDTRIDQIRRAIYQVYAAFFMPTGIVMNPRDWADIELKKDGENRYLFSNPNTTNIRMLWGLPVVESFAMPVGRFMVGAFSMAATVFSREGTTVAISDSHEDFFARNMIAIRAEERLALAIFRPKSFVYGTMLTP
jgi:HK97 family phage major capsid protein